MKPYPHKQNHLQLCVLMRSLEGSWHWDALPLIESTVCVLLCIAMHTWWFLNPLPLNFRAFNMVCWHLSVVTAFGGACYSAHTSPPGAGYLVGILNLENRVFDSGKLSYSCNAFFFFFFLTYFYQCGRLFWALPLFLILHFFSSIHFFVFQKLDHLSFSVISSKLSLCTCELPLLYFFTIIVYNKVPQIGWFKQ